jgi:cell division protein ZapD
VNPPVIYEQPLNERIRTLLRLEHLFRQASYRLAGNTLWDSRAALDALMDIQNVLVRNDIRSEVLKELERHASKLAPFEQNPNVDNETLQSILDELDVVADQLHAVDGQIGQNLKNNEFLNSVRQRSSIAGGSCAFDLPAYHYWLQQSDEKRKQDLLAWHGEYSAMSEAVNLILRLIRQSTPANGHVAEKGFFQLSLDSNVPFQLIRVVLAHESRYFAEISAGKHRFTVRFMDMVSMEQRPVQTETDVEFKLACCVL